MDYVQDTFDLPGLKDHPDDIAFAEFLATRDANVGFQDMFDMPELRNIPRGRVRTFFDGIESTTKSRREARQMTSKYAWSDKTED